MKNQFNTGYLYLVFLIIFIFLQFFFRVKPRLRLLSHNLINDEKYSIDSQKNLINLKSFDNRFSLGESYAFRDKTHWYNVTLLSFWKKKYLNLKHLKESFIEHDLKIKAVNSSNYALANYSNGIFVYACLDSPNDFYYFYNYQKNPRANDLNHWKNVFLTGIDNLFSKFKPSNYECLLIISSNKNFFEDSENDKRNLIFNKYFNYSEKK